MENEDGRSDLNREPLRNESLERSFREALQKGDESLSEFLTVLWHDEILDEETLVFDSTSKSLGITVRHRDDARRERVWKVGPFRSWRVPLCESRLTLRNVREFTPIPATERGQMIMDVEVSAEMFVVNFCGEDSLVVTGSGLQYSLANEDVPDVERRVTSLGIGEYERTCEKPG